jgi:hypothetical protein
VNGVEDVHELAFVLVDTFDLHVEQSVDWDNNAGFLLDPGSKTNFVLGLYSRKFLYKFGVLFVSTELTQVVKVTDPLVNRSDSVTDQIRKGSVAAVDPASGCDTVSLVLDFVGVQSFKF